MQNVKKHIYLISINILAVVLLTAGLPGCIKENVQYPKTNPGEVLIGLRLPVAFSGLDIQDIDLEHEDRIDVLNVLVFEPVTGNFIEALTAEPYAQDPTSRNPVYYVELGEGTFDLVFLANCADIIENSGALEGNLENIEEIREHLTISASKWIIDETDPAFRYMPMWGEKKGAVVTTNGADMRGPDKLVPMIRLMASIDVKLSTQKPSPTASLADKYTLRSILLYNYRYSGQLIPDEDAVDFNYDGTKWEYVVNEPSIGPTGFEKITVPLIYSDGLPASSYISKIYTFETEAKDKRDYNDHTEPLNYTCLVLGIGKKDGSGSGSVTRSDDHYFEQDVWYYRVDFINNSGEYVPLLRNHSYVVTVNDIINKGFPNPDLAFHSEPYELDYEVVDWDNYSFEEEITTGKYRLDISQTLINSPGKGGDWYIQITTTHPDGWYAVISGDPVDPSVPVVNPDGTPWLMLTSPAENTIQPAGQTVTQAINLQRIYLDSGRAYIHVISGNLTNVITVLIKKSEIE